MPPLTLPSVEPVSSGEIQTIDTDRLDLVESRHRQIAEFLKHCSFDAVLVSDPATIAWLTVGSRLQLDGLARPGATLFITPQARVVVCRSSESGQLFDREIAGLGFQLKERPWEQPRGQLAAELCNGRTVATDDPRTGGQDVTAELSLMRQQLVDYEAKRMRSLAFDIAAAVESTCRTFDLGETEAEVAGQVAHRLHRSGIQPSTIQVLADAQGHRYRHWSYGVDPIQRYATVKVVGERDGLFAGAGRTVSFGTPPRQISNAHEVASLVQATGMFFSQVGWTGQETWQRVARIYEKLGATDEWRQAEQADIVGYSPSELTMHPTAELTLTPGLVMHWHPSVRTAITSDTVLVREEGFELLSMGERWPMLKVVVKGHAVDRPGIFVREEGTDWAI